MGTCIRWEEMGGKRNWILILQLLFLQLGQKLLTKLKHSASNFSCVYVQFSSVTQLCLTLQPHESQHARPPCPSPTPEVYPNPCPLSQWCHPAISSSVVPFFSCPQSFPALGSFPMSQLLIFLLVILFYFKGYFLFLLA